MDARLPHRKQTAQAGEIANQSSSAPARMQGRSMANSAWRKAIAPSSMLCQEAKNGPNIPLQENLHRGI